MREQEPTDQRDHQALRDIFVSVTGETEITDRQNPETHKKVISLTESDSSSGEQRSDTDPATNGLKDPVGDSESE